ncbi:MAG TPA: MBL fold metallo-hydrolase [Chryseolinea sp.]|nr:MBL fold metallo-hydrolase [Chryseolinea sp.]
MKIFFKIVKWTMIITILLVAAITLITVVYMRQDKFGQSPREARLERMKKSPHYKDGKFHNIHHTPELTEGYTMLGVTLEFIFNRASRRRPVDTIPSIRTNIRQIPADQDVLIWFGHSSYFIQLDGKRFLIDPVFSGNASPIPGTNTSFQGTDKYTVDDLPDIDCLVISHDHYDHVDYETLGKLKDKTRQVICGLGVGSHFEHWGYKEDIIHEKDWNETVSVDSGFTVYTTTARHFSGRGFSRNNTLWMSYVLETPSMKIYIGGDSGYDTHYAEIGEKYGPIDIAILENGQYDIKWKYIHNLPEEVLRAAVDLKAKRVFPVHSSKFAMANHAWDEPLSRVTELNKSLQIPLITPVIGEIVYLKDSTQTFASWWVGLK